MKPPHLWLFQPLTLLLLTSCAAVAPVVVREPIPVALTEPTPIPALPGTASNGAIAGLLIDYDDRLGSCNADKAAIAALMSRPAAR